MSIRFKVRFVVFAALAVLVAGLYYLRVSSAILDYGDAEAEAAISTAVYSVLSENLDSSFGYDDFFTVIGGGEGVSYVFTNGVAVNVLSADIADGVMKYLSLKYTDGVDVPSGVFTGINLLAGFGSPVNFKMIRIASVKCELVSDFKAAGINQVKHSLYAKVVPELILKAVGRSRRVNSEINVLVFENVIVGKVPEFYFGSDKD